MTDLEPALEALARAFDREDAAQRGEPDPWLDGADDAEWVSERLACAQVAEAAYLAAARLSLPEAGKAVDEFAQAILHGDDEHRAWLTEAAVAFNAGEPLPLPRGKGTALASVPAPSGAEHREIDYIITGRGVTHKNFTIVYKDGGGPTRAASNGEQQASPSTESTQIEEPTARSNLVISAYRAMDAIDAIRSWCDAQKYGNDTITVARLRDMLPEATERPESDIDALAKKLRSRWGFGPHCRDTLPAEWQAALDEAAAALTSQREHIRKQAEDIMALGKLVYASETETWRDRATDLRRKLEEAQAIARSLDERLDASRPLSDRGANG